MVEDLVRNQPPLPSPRFPKLDPATVLLIYDKLGDTLIIRLGPAGPATSVDVDGEYWLRVNPTSGDVLGIEIEGFKAGYLKRHPDLAKLWTEAGRREGAGLRPESRLALVQGIVGSAGSAPRRRDAAAG